MKPIVTMVLLAVLPACGDALPCTACPAVEGTYAMTWEPGSSQGPCPAEGPRPARLVVEQTGSTLRTTVGGEPLGGTLYDSFDFSLTGGRLGTTYALRGLAVPTGTSRDGGVRLQGTLTTRQYPDGGDLCELAETYVGVRQ